MKQYNEVMTKYPVCCLPTDSVAKAADLMKNGNFGSIPVIENEETQKLVGIVTDRDLALTIVAEGRDAKSTNVEAVMTRKGVSCFAEDDLQKALDAMAKQQLRRIPIVDHENRIVGIITQADVATRDGLQVWEGKRGVELPNTHPREVLQHEVRKAQPCDDV